MVTMTITNIQTITTNKKITQTMSIQEKANEAYENQLNDWINQEKAAIDLIGTIGKLWFEKSIELILFRNQLVDRSASEIMSLHLYAKDIVKKSISVNDTSLLASIILNTNVCASRIDIGKLAFEYQSNYHNIIVSTYKMKEEDLLKRKLYDQFKRDKCKENGIKLIEVPQFNYHFRLEHLKDFIINKCIELDINLPSDILELNIDYSCIR